MLSENLFEGIGKFAGKNCCWWHKSAAQSACIASFRPLAITSGPGCHPGAFFHLKNEAPTGAGTHADLHKRSVPRTALSDELAASDITL
jgi:hypothetical protein